MSRYMTRMVAFLLLIPALAGSVMAAELAGVTPEELTHMQRTGAVLIDIRTPEEWRQSGLIPGSKPLMYFDARGGYDADAWLRRLGELKVTENTPIVLICRSGRRSGEVGRMLARERGYTRVHHLEKGVKAWAEQGKALVPCGGC